MSEVLKKKFCQGHADYYKEAGWLFEGDDVEIVWWRSVKRRFTLHLWRRRSSETGRPIKPCLSNKDLASITKKVSAVIAVRL